MKIPLIIMLLLCSMPNAWSQSKYPSTLWEITSASLAKPSYLFGTYHISSKGVFRLGDSVFYALKNVDIVAKEVNANTWQQEQFENDIMELNYNSLHAQLRPSSFTENTLNRTNTAEKLSTFMSFQPSFVNYYLYRNNAYNEGFQEEMYLDKFISSAGYKYGKEIRGLENYKESNRLGIEGQKDQADLEKKIVLPLPDGMSYAEMQDKIYDGYLNGNLDPLDSFQIYEFESKEFFNKFVIQRNYNQADSMDYYMKQGKALFAAVGAAHLPGNEGVIEILRKKGYTLRPVKLIYTNNSELESIKKKIVPVKMLPTTMDGVISLNAPGIMYPQEKSDILKSYGYADMVNSAYYFVSRLYNNAAYFGYNDNRIVMALDSLLYTSIKGDIVSKKIGVQNEYPCIDVVAKVKNKDLERYKFIVTPYEIIRFQVAGKNEYATSPFVDEFFNTIHLQLEQKLDNHFGFALKNSKTIHQWTNTSNGYVQNKQRFTQYDKSNKQYNTLLKIAIPNTMFFKEKEVMHLVRESILNSEAFHKDMIRQIEQLPIETIGKTNTLPLQDGKQMSIVVYQQLPHVYILTSLAENDINKEFIEGFSLVNSSYSTTSTYTDSNGGFTVSLPYTLTFDEATKKQLDRQRKTYESNKNPNSSNNLFYSPSYYGANSISKKYLFEDIDKLESMEMLRIALDSNLYYPNATAFWQAIIKRMESTGSRTTSSTYMASEVSSTYTGSTSSSRFNVELDKQKVENVQYDTTSSIVQKMQLELYDSTTGKRTQYRYILAQKTLFVLTCQMHQTEPTVFQKLITSSFAPITNNKPISIYTPKLENIIAEYDNAGKIARPNVLQKLNSIKLGLANLQQVQNLFQSHQQRNINNNILRRKLIDMVANGTYSDKEWPKVSAWLQKIFTTETELVTLRNFALECIIENEKLSDADWLVTNFFNTANSYQKKMSKKMLNYLQEVYPKTTVVPKVKLLLTEKDDIEKINLIDSGYLSIAEKKAAFNFYKLHVAGEALNMQLSQEKNDFLFNEKEINENMSTSNTRSDFKPLLIGFKYFYSLAPNDKFFTQNFDKIIASKSVEDMMQLLEVFLTAKKYEASKINILVNAITAEPNKLFEINQLFYQKNQYSKLSSNHKNKIELAKTYLLNEYRYSKLDSLQFIGAEKLPYNSQDSVYFFKYIKERQVNANIAYVVLDKSDKYLKFQPFSSFTNDQITRNETYEKVTNKIMRRLYTQMILDRRFTFYSNTNATKSLNSEE